ncbi:MAG TPA: uroporphyrinogen decarboxylase family protein [Thermotogota bacterium]|nr:uroporphyrinogen decarboxylase family protein [Thermotogota bacterium]HRW93647.1 uroporphyrinogen decarboxylase family protein [Thermotogota bacterium]
METMTPMERVMAALEHRVPDRVPFVYGFSFYGAKVCNCAVEDYFSDPALVARTQLELQRHFQHDNLVPFFYGSLEIEAFGGTSIFRPGFPPNSGPPIFSDMRSLKGVTLPDPEKEPLRRVLEVTRILKREVGDTIPLMGMVVSPFSLPAMQLGLDRYLEVLTTEPDFFHALMDVNIPFCIRWANAQLEAGATALVYFDPVSSPTLIPRPLFLRTGFEVARQVLPKINGPLAFHFASGRSKLVLEDLLQLPFVGFAPGLLENQREIFHLLGKKAALIGGLNNIEMVRWTPEDVQRNLLPLLALGKNGGLVISDQHGEVVWETPWEVLEQVSRLIRFEEMSPSHG